MQVLQSVAFELKFLDSCLFQPRHLPYTLDKAATLHFFELLKYQALLY